MKLLYTRETLLFAVFFAHRYEPVVFDRADKVFALCRDELEVLPCREPAIGQHKMKFQPRNGSWTRPNGPSWGCAGKARQRSGLLPARWSNAPSAPELDIFSGSVGRVAISPNR